MKLFMAGLVISVASLAIALGWAMRWLPADTPASVVVATIVLEDFRFSPNRLDAEVGQPLTVTLTNAGTQRHDLNFPSIHMPGLAGAQSILEPGETQTITLQFDGPGYHVFSCSVPGHAAVGMTGAVFVQ